MTRLILVITALLGLSVVVGPVRASASPIASCTSSTGTVIAVDFAHWRGPVVRGCDLLNPKTGAQLLFDAGFTLAGDNHDGPAFICRIGNEAFNGGTQYPTPSQDPCVVTPPASAYWSYWLAPAGQDRWTYSQLGAYSEKPKPGEVELWIFGGTHIQGSQGDPTDGFPICTPDSLRAGGSPTSCSPTAAAKPGTPSARPTSSARGAAGTRSTTTGGGSNGDRGEQSATNSGGSSSGHTGGATPASGSSSAPESAVRAGSSSSADDITDAAPAGPPGSGSAPGPSVLVEAKQTSKKASVGSATPLIVGSAIVAVLLAAGGGTVLRRRRQAD